MLTGSCVCCCDLCTTLLSSRPRACPAMQPAAAISLVCWASARGAPACFGATSLTRPVRPEPPFNTDRDVIFRYHFDVPFRGTILPQFLQGHERGPCKWLDKSNWLLGQDLKLHLVQKNHTLQFIPIHQPPSVLTAGITSIRPAPLDLNQSSSSNFDPRSRARDPQFPTGRLSIAKPTKQPKVN